MLLAEESGVCWTIVEPFGRGVKGEFEMKNAILYLLIWYRLLNTLNGFPVVRRLNICTSPLGIDMGLWLVATATFSNIQSHATEKGGEVLLIRGNRKSITAS